MQTSHVCDDNDVLYPSSPYFILHYIQVFGAKTSGFKHNGGPWFCSILSSSSFSAICLVFKINLLEKEHFSGLVFKLLLNSKFLTKFGLHTTQAQENLENLKGNYYFPFKSRKTSTPTSITLSTSQIGITFLCILSHFRMLI